MSRENEILFKLIPMTVNQVYESALDCLLVEGRMTENFGPWHRYDFKTLTFDFVSGVVSEYDDNDNLLVSCKLKLGAGEEV